MKYDFVRSKCCYPLREFDFDHRFTVHTLTSVLRASNVPKYVQLQLSGLQPYVLTSYQRKYFLSADEQVRLTLDFALEYYRISPHRNHLLNKRSESPHYIVAEAKYGTVADARVAAVTHRFPFRMSKHSKYVCGVEKLYM